MKGESLKKLDWKWLITLLLLMMILMRQNVSQREEPAQTQPEFMTVTGSVVIPVEPAVQEEPKVVLCH